MIMFKMHNQPDTRNRLDHMAQGIIGAPLDRPEGKLKVSGSAPYAAEYHLPQCAEGVLILAPIARGKVAKIDADSINHLPGILGVFADEAMLRRPAQGTAGKAPAQDASAVDYIGQPVALVVAETFEQAARAAMALKVEYEEDIGNAVFDPEGADAAPEVSTQSKPVEQGDLEEAMAQAAHRIDALYRTAGHASAAMEPHASIAEWHDGSLTLHGAYQMLGYNVKELADCLGVKPGKVRIVAPYVGGGFGSKLGISHEAVAAAVAAKALGRPVRVVMTRQQVFQTIMRRSETRQRVRLACDAGGRITGIGHEALVSNLPGEAFAEPVTQATEFLYGGENRTIRVDVARICRMTAGSVRAPGEAVGMQVLEAAMDELAEKIGLDPIELRKRNLPARHPTKDIPYGSRKLAEALDEGARRFGWEQRQLKPRQQREGEWYIGCGVAAATRVNMLGQAEARVTLGLDGALLVESDQTDIGTGSYAVLGQIAGEMLGVTIENVTVRLGDSDLPTGAGSGGSIGANSTGSAVLDACDKIRSELARRLGVDAGELILKDGMAAGANLRKPVTELLSGKSISETGMLRPGKTTMDYAQASDGAFFVEVAVNAYTGETRVRRMLGVFGIGRVLNAKTARSQAIGGMVWGIGSALTEALEFDKRDGHLANHDLAEYHVPVNRDVPAIEAYFLDERDPVASPLQGKGVGELGICGAAGAVANAIYNACGVRVRSFPITLDKILAELPDPD